jgi:L-iditol 2-dehydrogenase
MIAAVYYAPGDIRVEKRPEPVPERDNLIVEVDCCAICGTDVKLSTVGNPRCHPPRIIGHEFAGHTVHVGSEVIGYALGQRISMATTIACGGCPYCARGLGNLCPKAKSISYDYDGAFAERLAIPGDAIRSGNVIAVADNVPDDAAALSEPLSCAINAQEIAGIKDGDVVLILGGGPLGALNAEVAKALGASTVIVVQRSEPRLSMVRKLEDVVVVGGEGRDIGVAVREATAGLGADAAIVCAPSAQAMEEALSYVRKGGTVSLFASLPKDAPPLSLDSRAIHYGELRIVGASDSRPAHVQRALDLLAAGRIDVDSVVTHRIRLDQLDEGLRLMRGKKSLKVLVFPTSEEGI